MSASARAGRRDRPDTDSDELLIRLYRHVLRVGDRPLAELLTRAFRAEPALAAAADAELRALSPPPRRHRRC
jgi:hypothetical protein